MLFAAATVLVLPSCGKSDSNKMAHVEKQAVEVAATEAEELVETGESTEDITENETEILETTTTEIEDTEPVRFLFAGDLCLEEDGFVLDYFDEVGGDLTRCVSPYLLERMAMADIFMMNHEYAISSRGSRLDKYYTFRADPSRISILKQMSVDLVSLANNHVYDYGYDAFADTLNLLDENGIRHVGAGMNASSAEKVEYFDIRGIRIGVVSASRAEKYVITPQATDSQPGVFWMYDDTRLIEVVSEAASQCDFLIAYLHWGTEDSKYYEDYQHDIAQKLVDSGVDAIIGGHPHIVQGMEYVGDVPVFYSLGDFWFNGADKYSMMVQLSIYKNGTSEVEIIPCRQQNYTITYMKDEEEQEEFFDYMRELSPNVIFHNN